MKTNIRHMARVFALSLVFVVSLTIGATFKVHQSALVSVNTFCHSDILLACCDGQESHGGKGGGGGGGGGGGHSHG